eukprot:scaffold53252_cov56-Phaeocystis_antarctica.AAC.2
MAGIEPRALALLALAALVAVVRRRCRPRRSFEDRALPRALVALPGLATHRAHVAPPLVRTPWPLTLKALPRLTGQPRQGPREALALGARGQVHPQRTVRRRVVQSCCSLDGRGSVGVGSGRGGVVRGGRGGVGSCRGGRARRDGAARREPSRYRRSGRRRRSRARRAHAVRGGARVKRAAGHPVEVGINVLVGNSEMQARRWLDGVRRPVQRYRSCRRAPCARQQRDADRTLLTHARHHHWALLARLGFALDRPAAALVALDQPAAAEQAEGLEHLLVLRDVLEPLALVGAQPVIGHRVVDQCEGRCRARGRVSMFADGGGGEVTRLDLTIKVDLPTEAQSNYT